MTYDQAIQILNSPYDSFSPAIRNNAFSFLSCYQENQRNRENALRENNYNKDQKQADK